MEKFFGILTLVLAVSMVAIALPSQIVKNYKLKKSGLSIWMVLLPLSVYISRSVYSFMIESYYIFIPDILGVIFSLILLWQYIKYIKFDREVTKP
jgi:hypothetical protein